MTSVGRMWRGRSMLRSLSARNAWFSERRVVTFPAQEQRARAERPFSPQMPTFRPSHLKAPRHPPSTQTWRPRSLSVAQPYVLFNTHGATELTSAFRETMQCCSMIVVPTNSPDVAGAAEDLRASTIVPRTHSCYALCAKDVLQYLRQYPNHVRLSARTIRHVICKALQYDLT